MRAVVQRVSSARIEVDGDVVGQIDRGLLAYVGFGRHDAPEDRGWVLSRIAGLRVFAEPPPAEAEAHAPSSGKMSRGVADVGGAILLVSQFTLYGDVRRGRRPSFDEAMPAEQARVAYEEAVRELRGMGLRVETGRFQADMKVHSVNDGPVTIWIDSADRAAPRAG
jgi:D-tyrosyl-tRNA(Tyr) deacylase